MTVVPNRENLFCLDSLPLPVSSGVPSVIRLEYVPDTAPGPIEPMSVVFEFETRRLGGPLTWHSEGFVCGKRLAGFKQVTDFRIGLLIIVQDPSFRQRIRWSDEKINITADINAAKFVPQGVRNYVDSPAWTRHFISQNALLPQVRPPLHIQRSDVEVINRPAPSMEICRRNGRTFGELRQKLKHLLYAEEHFQREIVGQCTLFNAAIVVTVHNNDLVTGLQQRL